MRRNDRFPLSLPLASLCAVALALTPAIVAHAAEEEQPPAASADEQRSFQERLRGLWGDARDAGSELGSRAGEAWDSARESSAGLWNEARKQGSSWADEARRRWKEAGE